MEFLNSGNAMEVDFTRTLLLSAKVHTGKVLQPSNSVEGFGGIHKLMSEDKANTCHCNTVN